MKITAIKAYTDTAVQDASSSTSNLKNSTTQATRKVEKLLNNNIDLNDKNSIVSKKEREFFINMFPANSEQLAKHVLFNRSGRLQSPDINKGVIFDGKA